MVLLSHAHRETHTRASTLFYATIVEITVVKWIITILRRLFNVNLSLLLYNAFLSLSLNKSSRFFSRVTPVCNLSLSLSSSTRFAWNFVKPVIATMEMSISFVPNKNRSVSRCTNDGFSKFKDARFLRYVLRFLSFPSIFAERDRF